MVQWLVETYLAVILIVRVRLIPLWRNAFANIDRPFVHSSAKTTQSKTRLLNSSVPALTNITPTKPVEK